MDSYSVVSALFDENKTALTAQVCQEVDILACTGTDSYRLVYDFSGSTKKYSEGRAQSPNFCYGAILDSVTFSICYLISMWNTQRMRIHTAFLIGACLVIFNSGIGRLIALISNDLAILVMVLLPIIIPGAIMVYEKAKLRRAMLKSPYLLFMLIWILEVIVFITLPQQEFWKGFIRGVTINQNHPTELSNGFVYRTGLVCYFA